ncbi:DUF402 domain-containing protein [Bacillus sp. RO3]|nr:DUF402 domain-containing protein [Bacillus sp. RO3]
MEKEVSIQYTSSGERNGYLSLVTFKKVSHPLYARYENISICIANDGFSWLQFFPDQCHYSITAMLNKEQAVIQWYIDITKENGYDAIRGPWMDDLYLDIIVLPDGNMITKDLDELQDAYKNEVISKVDYLLANTECERLVQRIEQKKLNLEELTREHLAFFRSSV